MGPLADSQVTISPVFYCCLVDLWGPITAYVPVMKRSHVVLLTSLIKFTLWCSDAVLQEP